MAIYLRIKQAMDPLDHDTKARLRGGDSSGGSDHEPLSCLLHDFFLDSDDSTDSEPSVVAPDDFSDDDDKGDKMESMLEEIRELHDAREGGGDLYRLRLITHVTKVAETLAALRTDASTYRRSLMMARLREDGYDASLCKVKWQGSAKLVGGKYEYIDVVAAAAHGGRRYIVELDFAAEFEVARASAEYRGVVAALPELMVAGTEDVWQLVRVAVRATSWSLKSRDLHVPPWRKERYMMAKWLGPYRRTVNAIPASSAGVPSSVADGRTICRASGFSAMATAVRLSAARIR